MKSLRIIRWPDFNSLATFSIFILKPCLFIDPTLRRRVLNGWFVLHVVLTRPWSVVCVIWIRLCAFRPSLEAGKRWNTNRWILKSFPTQLSACSYRAKVEAKAIQVKDSGGSGISRWGRQPQRGTPTYYLANFSRKLHEKIFRQLKNIKKEQATNIKENFPSFSLGVNGPLKE